MRRMIMNPAIALHGPIPTSSRLTRSLASLAVLAAATVGLSACSGAEPTESPSPSATPGATGPATPASSGGPSESPSPTPTAAASPSPAASAAGSCEDDQIVPGRLGCIDTNAPASENPGKAQLAFAPDYCAPGVGRWTYVPNPEFVSIGGHDAPILGRIDVYDPSLTTPEGIHVGSSESDVVGAYGGLTPVEAMSGVKLLVVSNAEGSYVIELANEWGASPTFSVVNIRIYAAGIDANYPVYGTEDFAAYCPIDF